MVRYALKKLLFHLGVCLLVWFLILRFSLHGKLYAGWFAGVLAACYLLAGWLSYLKSQGTDLGKLIRRKRAPETAEEQSSVVPGNARNRAKAIALAINGVLMFVLSAL